MGQFSSILLPEATRSDDQDAPWKLNTLRRASGIACVLYKVCVCMHACLWMHVCMCIWTRLTSVNVCVCVDVTEQICCKCDYGENSCILVMLQLKCFDFLIDCYMMVAQYWLQFWASLSPLRIITSVCLPWEWSCSRFISHENDHVVRSSLLRLIM